MLSIRMAEILKEAVFPSRCIVCGSFFHGFSGKYFVHTKNHINEISEMENISFERVMYPFLCTACCNDYLPVESPVCSSCGDVFKSREGEDHLCQKCIEHPKRFGKARAIFFYSQAVMEVIHSFKYKGKIQVAASLELLLFSVLLRHWKLRDFDIVIPVPLHIKRFRARGFNQAYFLIRNLKELAERFKVESGRIEIGKDVIERTVWTQPQTGLGKEERIKNIKGAFTVKDFSKVKAKRILLVDDVYTTGATVDECAKVLIKNGAKSVDVLTLARAV